MSSVNHFGLRCLQHTCFHLPVLHCSRTCLSEPPEKNILEKGLKEDRHKKQFLAASCGVDFKHLFPWNFFSNVLTSLNQIYSQAGVRFGRGKDI